MSTTAETVAQRPPIEHTVSLTYSECSLDVTVDDLPAAPAVPRDARRELARLAAALLSQLHGVEAQITSLGRELATPGGVTSERAIQLVASTLTTTRIAISTFQIQAERVGR